LPSKILSKENECAIKFIQGVYQNGKIKFPDFYRFSSPFFPNFQSLDQLNLAGGL
jgi:hypothetical protein